MQLATTISGQRFQFVSLKEVLAKAGEEKSGDRLAGIAAGSERERVAAKCVLADVTLALLHDDPVVAYEDDEVTRITLDNLDQAAYQSIKNWTVAELREFLLNNDTTLADVQKIQNGLTGEMAAACTKIMSNMDLVLLRASVV